MKPDSTPPAKWGTSIGLGAQLLISHAVAAAAAVVVARVAGVPAALVAAALVGIALTFTLQRTLWLMGRALARLKESHPPAQLPARWHGPLAGLVAQVNVLLAGQREVYELRESLLTQARNAAAQQERNRLARELHDSIKQQIFSVSMSAAAARARWDNDPQGAREALGDVRRAAQEAMVEMTALLQQLSPAPLEKVGLVQALRDQCQALGYRTEAKVTVEFGELPPDERMPAGAQESIFRIAQEAFSNVARHARADQVRLYLGQPDPDGPLRLEIQDDGQGFDIKQAEGGMGLESIRQRAQALGGKVDLDSAPGQGTKLQVTIPLSEPLITEEEKMQDHTLNKVFLVGLGGGLGLMAALFYPLYMLQPGHFVPGWPTGLETVGLITEIVAAALAVGVGYLSARWAKAESRRRGALLGALAGGVAGVTLYFGLGAPAAAALGARGLLARGLVPAADRADIIRLLAESVSGIVWYSHRAFWAALLVGTGLGAMGGLLAPPAAQPTRRAKLYPIVKTILAAAAVVGAAAVFTAVQLFALLEPTMRVGLSTPLAPGVISGWLIGTPLLLYLIASFMLYLLLRDEIKKSEDPTQLEGAGALAALFSLVSCGLLVYVGALGTPTLQGTTLVPRGWMDVTGLMHPSPLPGWGTVGAWPLVMLLGSLALGGLYLAAMRTAQRRQRALGGSPPSLTLNLAIIGILLVPGLLGWAVRLPPLGGLLIGLAIVLGALLLTVGLLRASKGAVPYTLRLTKLGSPTVRAINAGLGLVVAIVTPLMTIISTQVGIGMITNQLNEVLWGYSFAAQEFTLVELVSDLYLRQASAFLISFVGATALLGLLTLLITGIIAIPEQLSARGVEAV